MAQSVAHVLGNDEVPGPNPGISSSMMAYDHLFFCFTKKAKSCAFRAGAIFYATLRMYLQKYTIYNLKFYKKKNSFLAEMRTGTIFYVALHD